MENRFADEQAAAPHAMLNKSYRHGSGVLAALLSAIVLAALVAAGSPASASSELDQLRLTGTIKSVNAATGLVTVDVVSSSCSGMRVFKADSLDTLEAYIDTRVSFFIDSSRCNIKETYTILTARGLRK